MKLLIDTHALIWFAENSRSLSTVAREQIESGENEIYYSVASIWEMTIKHQLGKLELKSPLDSKFRKRMLDNGIHEVRIEFEHVVQTGHLPFHHRDPFDRLLVAQAMVGGFRVVSQDAHLDAYPVKRIW